MSPVAINQPRQNQRRLRPTRPHWVSHSPPQVTWLGRIARPQAAQCLCWTSVAVGTPAGSNAAYLDAL